MSEHTLRTRYLLTLLSLLTFFLTLVHSQNKFNYQIVSRVHDELNFFTDMIEKAINFPVLQMKTKNIPVNTMDIDQTMRTLIYPVKLIFPQVNI